MSKELKRLDFSPGIKADDINFNFDLVHAWLERERLRTAGHGLVEGFDMTANLRDFTITVGTGMLINETGEEIEVPPSTFRVGAPDSIDISEEVIPDNEGAIKLKFVPYSPTKFGFIFYNPPTDSSYPAREEFHITDVDSGSRVPILSVIGQDVVVNATNWAGHKLRINYKYSRNRIDSIMLHKDGTYAYQKGIMSTSPSHVDLGDYPDYRAIGIVYWEIDRTVSVQFFDTYRTYRKVYVDKQNRLYLNGKLYKESQEIFFVEPEAPQVNDLWYDHTTNMLMIWKEQDGDFGWVVVNDVSTVPIRQMKMWTPTDFPADAQTFLFREDELNLHFIPDSNALEIVIDQAVVMSDQFTEIVLPSDKSYLSNGIGFKLKTPLDKATFVQVTVNHSVRSAPLRETFQRAAIFITENFVSYNTLNTAKIFTTEIPYVMGEQQLEVFIEGKRLQRGIDFLEMVNASTTAAAGNRGEMSNTFKVLKTIASGEAVTHKITRQVWSFDHLDQMVHDIEDKADDALDKCAQLRTDLTNLNTNVATQFTAINSQVAAINSKVADLNIFVKKTDRLVMNNIPTTALAGMMAGSFNVVKSTTGDILLTDTKLSDFVLVFYVSATMNRILMRDMEYTTQTAGSDVRISLQPDLVSSGASLYITGIKFGLSSKS
jgi:hypothetical protein